MKNIPSNAPGFQRFKHLRPQNLRRWLVGAGLAAMAFISFGVAGGASPPNIPVLPLATESLFGASTNEKPAMALALSVEFPTVGAQYRGASDYSAAKEYIGYYDHQGCYTYNDAPTETPRTGLTAKDYKRFDRTGSVASPGSRKCSGEQFSGNFLNWASNSAIDMMRMALSGGDRYIDNENLTILQRAVLPDGNPSCFWNSGGYFPAKSVAEYVDGVNDYAGAVPESMRKTATDNGNKIWIANKLNGIYFRAGASSAGSCTDSTGYTLGASSLNIGPRDNYISASSSDPAGSGWTQCSGNQCSFSGTKDVLYVERAGTKSSKYTSTTGPVANGVICNKVNLSGGNSFPDKTISCYYKNYSGSWKPELALNSDGFFFSRVQVCNASGGVLQDSRDFSLCKKYPSGVYKPTGAIQKYSDQLRMAAFGYLMDTDDPKAANSTSSFGGVLRAPMKYVGEKTFDINGQYLSSNSKAEWDERTGQFFENPEGNTTVVTTKDVSSTGYSSGVINYLNKFGRTGPTFGRYKQFDPVGELHYEVVRYLQGLEPTSLAISKITGTKDADFSLRDGFPAYTAWTDPYGDGRTKESDYSCVKSNIVVVGDMNTHDGDRFPAKDLNNNVFSATEWRDVVVKFEKNTSGTYIDGQKVSRNISNPNASNDSIPNSKDRSKLMGSAYWSHTHDIRGTDWTNNEEKQRPGLRVKTFTFDVNENSFSDDDVNRRTKNQFFMASKYGGFESDPSNYGGNPYNTYGNPFIDERTSAKTTNNKIWQEADTVKFPDRAGEAGTYYLQKDGRQVLAAFDEIFNRASSKAQSIAKPGANRSSVVVGNSALIYQGRFDTGDWSGDVEATEVSLSTDKSTSINLRWSAAARLAALSSPATSRNIVMGTSAGAMDFSSSSSFSFLTANEVNYLRGDRSLEGTVKNGSVTWRKRGALLGDVVNSAIVYSGPPSKRISEVGYKDFYEDNKARTPAVFVGANDGMLHAFNANTGDETFAFIPQTMAPKLASLTNSTYISNHQNFVDGAIAVAEARFGTTKTKADWKTVLLGANGGGARSVFALDVTNPGAFDASKVLWEFTSADDADMGYVIGQPQILKLRTSATDLTYKWFAVVASGVNNYADDGNGNFSSTGKPALFILSLDKDASSSWVLNGNYYKVSLPIDSLLTENRPTGLANFTPIFGSADEVREIFMGDYYGNVWNLQFNIRGTSTWRPPSEWDSYNLSPFKKFSNAYPFYIAKDKDEKNQVIHEAPLVVSGPIVAQAESFFVFFGTGKFIEVVDKSSTDVSSIYALYDNSSTKADDTTTPVAIKGRGRLRKGVIDTTEKTVTVENFLWGRPDKDSDTATTERAGWYADFPISGERVVGLLQMLGNRKAVFNTQIPAAAGASGGCSAGSATTNSYLVDIPSGAGKYTPIDGPASPPLLLQIGASTDSSGDPTGRSTRSRTFERFVIGATGLRSLGDKETVKELIGRLSWRQINNYQDLKNKANP